MTEKTIRRYLVPRNVYADTVPITILNFERETAKFLISKYGRRIAKVSHHEKYFETYEDARAYVLQTTLENMQKAKAEMKKQEERLNAFTRMLPEEEPDLVEFK